MKVCENCGKELRKDWLRFCSWDCSAALAEKRSVAFQLATSSKQGKPPDGVTYGRGKKE